MAEAPEAVNQTMHQGTVGSNWRDDLSGITDSVWDQWQPSGEVPADVVRKIFCPRFGTNVVIKRDPAKTMMVRDW